MPFLSLIASWLILLTGANWLFQEEGNLALPGFEQRMQSRFGNAVDLLWKPGLITAAMTVALTSLLYFLYPRLVGEFLQNSFGYRDVFYTLIIFTVPFNTLSILCLRRLSGFLSSIRTPQLISFIACLLVNLLLIFLSMVFIQTTVYSAGYSLAGTSLTGFMQQIPQALVLNSRSVEFSILLYTGLFPTLYFLLTLLTAVISGARKGGGRKPFFRPSAVFTVQFVFTALYAIFLWQHYAGP